MPPLPTILSLLLLPSAMAARTMRQVRALGPCAKPFASCVRVASVPFPEPRPGYALVSVNGTSVNPSDVDTVEYGGCTLGCGNDVAGTVLTCENCTRLRPGDRVWGAGSPAYAEAVSAPEAAFALAPGNVPLEQAGTIPEVGLTSLFSLKRTGSLPSDPMPSGSPWDRNRTLNLSVVITAGSGGTGFIGIEIAKAYGAAHIATAATGAEEIAFVRRLGATYVADYKREDLLASLPADSVDVVYDNYGAEGTADKAMRALRKGGVYLLLPHGECYVKKTQGPPCLSANPKPGVRQINYDTSPDFAQYSTQGLQELTRLFEAGVLTAQIARTFRGLESAAAAFNFSAGGGAGGVSGNHFGKIALVPN